MRIATSETILSHYCPECEILRLYMACTRKRFRIYNILYNSTCLYRVLNPQMPCKKSNRRNFAGFSQVLHAYNHWITCKLLYSIIYNDRFFTCTDSTHILEFLCQSSLSEKVIKDINATSFQNIKFTAFT